MAISKRLKASAKYLKGFNCLADCGTDHAYLPIYAVMTGIIDKAIASDNKIGPIANAKTNIMKANLLKKIHPLYAEGLSYLNEDIDVVSVIGMGGRLIADILEKANTKYVKRFVLGPNSEMSYLRAYLQDSNYKIVEEEIVEEKNKFYQIIVLEPGEMTLNELELEFGPINLKQKTPELEKYISKIIENLEDAFPKINTEVEKSKMKERINMLREVMS